MADPLTAIGAAASVAQLIVLARDLCTRLREYHSAAERVPQVLINLTTALPLLADFCEVAQERCYSDGAQGDGSRAKLDSVIKQSLGRVKKLDELTRGLSPDKTDSRVQRTVKAVRSMAKEKELMSLHEGLRQDNQLITNYLSVRNCSIPALPKPAPVRAYPSSAPGIKRTHILREVSNALIDLAPGQPRVAVLHGLGGQGKTSLALDFCRAESERYEVILWMNASSLQSLQLSFANGLRVLSSRRRSIYDLQASFEELNTELADRTWLLVFDNYDDPRTVPGLVSYFPANGKGAIIVTTRHCEVRNLGNAIDVGGMEEDEAIALLLSRARHNKEGKHLAPAAREIVQLLGYLPLAIDQASAYIEERNLALELFKKHYNDRRERILQQVPALWDYKRSVHDGSERKEVPQSVMTTWELSFSQLHVPDDTREHLIKFLSISAMVAEDSIMEDLFKEYSGKALATDSIGHWLNIFLSNGDWDTYTYQDLLAVLANHSLIQKFGTDSESSAFAIHPIVKQWLLLRIPSAERREYIHETSRLLVASGSSTLLQFSRRLSEQMISYQDAFITSSASLLPADTPLGAGDLREPAVKFVDFYASRARWDKAAALLRLVLQADEKRAEQEERETTHVKCRLAEMYTNGSMFSEARSLLEPLVSQEYWESKEDPTSLLKATAGMAAICMKEDRTEEARVLYERAIELQKTKSISGGPDKARILTELAHVYRFLAEHDKASTTYQEALQESGDPHSLNALRAKMGLADLFRNKAEFQKAKELYLQAVDGLRELRGPEHPETIRAQCDLAITHRNLREWQKAEEAFCHVIAHFERVLGQSHLDSLRAKMNLALVYHQCGEIAKARSLYVLVLEGRERKLRPGHGHTLRTVERLTAAMVSMGDDIEAEALAMRTLKAGGKVTELEASQWVLTPHRLLALERLNDLAIEGHSRKLGGGHMDLEETRDSLAMVKERQRAAETKGFITVVSELGPPQEEKPHRSPAVVLWVERFNRRLQKKQIRQENPISC